MKSISKKDFEKTKTIQLCYVFGIKVNKDDTIERVYYYRYINEVGSFEARNWDVQSFAKKIINAEWIAYAGKLSGSGDDMKLENPSLITIQTIDGVLYLTTASDDSKSNNLFNLTRFY